MSTFKELLHNEMSTQSSSVSTIDWARVQELADASDRTDIHDLVDLLRDQGATGLIRHTPGETIRVVIHNRHSQESFSWQVTHPDMGLDEKVDLCIAAWQNAARALTADTL